MDLNVLREFIMLSKTLNISLVSREVYLSQSMVSKHIRALEAELGVPLFIRSKRGLRLSDAGKAFAVRIQPIVDALDGAIAEARAVDDAHRRRLVVCYPRDTTDDYFPEACVRFHRANPEVRLTRIAAGIGEIGDAVLAGDADLGLVIAPDGQMADLKTAALRDGELGLICLKGHALVEQGGASVHQLKGIPVLVPNPTAMPLISRITKQLFDGCSFRPSLVEEMYDIVSIRPFLLTESGGVVLTVSQIFGYLRGNSEYAFVPLVDSPVKPLLCACWKESHESKALLDLVECLKEALADGRAR